MKKVLFIGAEVMPFAATGGLGDVLGSLPAALQKTGACEVRVMLPLYRTLDAAWRAQMREAATFTVQIAWRRQPCKVYALAADGARRGEVAVVQKDGKVSFVANTARDRDEATCYYEIVR